MERINRVQVIIGIAALFIGSLVYLIDRPADQTYFIYRSSIGLSLHNVVPKVFGVVGNTLPAFIHVFSFILLTAGLVAYRRRHCLIICLAWFVMDCAFELGQKFSIQCSAIIPDWFAGIPFLENTKGYFLSGTFDALDLGAILIGTGLAYFILLRTMERKRQ